MKKLLSTLFIVLALVLSFAMVADAVLTVTINRSFGNANSVERVRDITIGFDASYPTGGESLTVDDVAIGTTMYMVTCDSNDGYVFQYDYTNSLLMAFWVDTTVDGAPLAQVVNTTDLSGITDLRCRVSGK